MIRLLNALKAAAEDALPVYLFDATGVNAYPYAVLWTGTGTPGSEESLAGARAGVDEDLRVTIAAGTGPGVVTNAQALRDQLVPGGRIRRLSVDGWHDVTLRFEETLTDVGPDRDATIPGTNRHPFFAVDRYRIRGVRTPPTP